MAHPWRGWVVHPWRGLRLTGATIFAIFCIGAPVAPAIGAPVARAGGRRCSLAPWAGWCSPLAAAPALSPTRCPWADWCSAQPPPACRRLQVLRGRAGAAKYCLSGVSTALILRLRQIATRARIQSTGRSEDPPGLCIKHSDLRCEHPVRTTSTQIRAARERPWRSLPRFTCARELLYVRPRVRPSVRTGVTRKWPVPRNQVMFQVAPGGRPGSWWVWGVAC